MRRRFAAVLRRPGRIFPTSLTGDVTSEIAEDDWERGWGKSSKKAETRKYMRGSGRYADVFLVKEHRPRSYILFIFYFYLFYSSNS